jgi:hypothetical protein
MRKILITAAAGAALAITPALAAKPAAKPDHPTHPATPAKCKINSVGYNAKGTLVSHTLTQTKGADTATDPSDDRWSGDIVVNVTRANHKAPKGEQTFTVTDIPVNWGDTAGAPAAGDTVRLHGKLTKIKKKCEGPSTVITVKRVGFEKAAPTT